MQAWCACGAALAGEAAWPDGSSCPGWACGVQGVWQVRPADKARCARAGAEQVAALLAAAGDALAEWQDSLHKGAVTDHDIFRCAARRTPAPAVRSAVSGVLAAFGHLCGACQPALRAGVR